MGESHAGLVPRPSLAFLSLTGSPMGRTCRPKSNMRQRPRTLRCKRLVALQLECFKTRWRPHERSILLLFSLTQFHQLLHCICSIVGDILQLLARRRLVRTAKVLAFSRARLSLDQSFSWSWLKQRPLSLLLVSVRPWSSSSPSLLLFLCDRPTAHDLHQRSLLPIIANQQMRLPCDVDDHAMR